MLSFSLTFMCVFLFATVSAFHQVKCVDIAFSSLPNFNMNRTTRSRSRSRSPVANLAHFLRQLSVEDFVYVKTPSPKWSWFEGRWWQWQHDTWWTEWNIFDNNQNVTNSYWYSWADWSTTTWTDWTATTTWFQGRLWHWQYDTWWTEWNVFDSNHNVTSSYWYSWADWSATAWTDQTATTT